jgi:hypothetical protein
MGHCNLSLRWAVAVVAFPLVYAGLAQSQEIGHTRSVVQQVSFEELLANAASFSGQPVRLIGVADLGEKFEESRRLYFSREAFSNRTYQYLDVELADDLVVANAEALGKLTGQYIVIEGIFTYDPPAKIDPIESKGQIEICLGSCPTNGVLGEINFVAVR